MRTAKVRVSYGVTKNMGNYESLRLDYGVDLEVDDDESPAEVFTRGRKALRDMVDRAIEEEIEHLHGKVRKPKVRS